jgi:hypothetical protein
VVRQGHPKAVVGAYLIALVVVCCGGGGPGNNIDERDGQRRAAATNEESTAPKADQPKAQTAQKPVGLDAEIISPLGQANVPLGFGEGSLWATGFDPRGAGCDDVKGVGEAACGGGSTKTLLKRVEPRTGEVVAAIPLECVHAGTSQLAVGADSVWVSSGYYSRGPTPRSPCDVVVRVDPQTKRAVDQIPVDLPAALAFGHGSVWVTSATYGTLARIDPQTGEVVAKIDVDEDRC